MVSTKCSQPHQSRVIGLPYTIPEFGSVLDRHGQSLDLVTVLPWTISPAAQRYEMATVTVPMNQCTSLWELDQDQLITLPNEP